MVPKDFLDIQHEYLSLSADSDVPLSVTEFLSRSLVKSLMHVSPKLARNYTITSPVFQNYFPDDEGSGYAYDILH